MQSTILFVKADVYFGRREKVTVSCLHADFIYRVLLSHYETNVQDFRLMKLQISEFKAPARSLCVHCTDATQVTYI
jgi:hypothetical protein